MKNRSTRDWTRLVDRLNRKQSYGLDETDRAMLADYFSTDPNIRYLDELDVIETDDFAKPIIFAYVMGIKKLSAQEIRFSR